MYRYLCFHLLAAIAFIAASETVTAYQQFTTYRLAGTDLVAITSRVGLDEDPEELILTLTEGAGDASELILESDLGFGDCKTDLEQIIGVKEAYAEIVLDQSADTLNGVRMLQCSVFWGLFRIAQ